MIPGLSEAFIRQHCALQSFSRGQDYLRSGAVRSLDRRGQEVQARVEGSSYEPYLVRVAFDAGGLTEAFCTCPYDWGGWCKHIVAVLLACLRDTDQINEHPPLEALLEELDRAALIALMRDLAAHEPRLFDFIEARVARRTVSEKNADGSIPPVDAKAVRRRVHGLLHSLDGLRRSEAYWHVESVVDEVRREVDQARAFLDAGDAQNACRYLGAVTDAYVEEWTWLDDSDGFAGLFFEDLGKAWTEIALSDELPRKERKALRKQLTAWQRAVEDYGLEEAFFVATLAVEGWDDAFLQVEAEKPGYDDGVRAWYADELVEARLNVLERQERFDDYLRLAEDAGHLVAHLTMLARLGRSGEAVSLGLDHLASPEQAFALARALREAGAGEEALVVGREGLSLEGQGLEVLAPWLCDLATVQGQPEAALEAAIAAVRAAPSLPAYQRAQALAGDAWPGLRETLLAALRDAQGYGVEEAQVEIFLHEDLLDEAIAVADQHPMRYELVRRVAEAAVAERPEWVVPAARRQAEEIIEAGRAARYAYAIEWLKYVRDAYRQLDDETAWRDLIGGIQERHSRKYKLMSLIKERL